MNIIRFVIPIVILLLIEFLAYNTYSSWASTFKPQIKWWLMLFYIVCTLILLGFILSFGYLRKWNEVRELRAIVSVTVMSILLAKLLIASIASIDFILRGIYYLISLFYTTKSANANDELPFIIRNGLSRSAFIRNLAIGMGGSIMGIMLYGMSNRYNYKVRKIKVPIKNLPPELAALKIVQISDIHSGSFTDIASVQKGVDTINALKPDIIFFTGDLVNDLAIEMKDYEVVFKQLNATFGVYSTLGNHDYADYYYSEEQTTEKALNLQALKDIHRRMNWQLLLNETKVLQIGNAQLAIIGVENIAGKGKFHSYGNMPLAYEGAKNIPFKILLSHDPSHWEYDVKHNYPDVQLTLSGHTHGMQFGIDVPGLKFSPVQFMYKQWAGLYNEKDSFLYVNRGFGFIGYPGRVGILPEITFLQLQNAV
jgi:uncharacterized protein